MNKWVVKAVVQKIISYLPYKYKINYFLQRNVTGGAILNDAYFEQKFRHFSDHVQYLDRLGAFDFKKADILEVGTGWYPIIPIGFFLLGSPNVHSIDVAPLVNLENIKQTIRFYLKRRSRLSELGSISFSEMRWGKLAHLYEQMDELTWTQVLQQLHLDIRTGSQAYDGIVSGSVHYVCSNNTLEHVYPDDLRKIFRHFKRVLHEDGLMSHFIDMTDHYAHFDPSISVYHFLRFSTAQWNIINNSIQPMNRLRLYEYMELFDQLGFLQLDVVQWPNKIDELRQIRIGSTYRNVPVELLAPCHAYLIYRHPKNS